MKVKADMEMEMLVQCLARRNENLIHYLNYTYLTLAFDWLIVLHRKKKKQKKERPLLLINSW